MTFYTRAFLIGSSGGNSFFFSYLSDTSSDSKLKGYIMLITLLELVGCKRLSLNHINKITITPKNKTVLILGSNGSGKSTCLQMLTPLPGDPKDFHKEGYKLIEITKGQDKYILRSSFGSTGNKFSFLKNNEELNLGGTATVYKELVKKEFNITQEVHELMTGVTLFHQMSVAERRNWFTKISDTDYSFALSYYQRLKEQLRDIQGAIKLNQSRLVQETSKLLTPQEEDTAREEISFLSNSINSLLEIKHPIQNSKNELINTLDNQTKQIEVYTNQIYNLLCRLNVYEQFSSRDNLLSEIGQIQTKLQLLKNEHELLCSKITDLEKANDLLKNNNVTSLSSLDKDMGDLIESIDELYKQLRYSFHFTDDKLALQAIYGVLEDVRTVIADLPPNQDRKISRDYYTHLETDNNRIKTTIVNIEQNLSTLLIKQKELEHIRDHNSIECPKCQYVWHKGYSEAEYTKLLNDIKAKKETLDTWQNGLVENTKLLESAKEYLEAYRMYSRVTSGYSNLSSIWEHILNSNIIFDNPSKVPTLLENVRGDLLIKIKIAELSKQHQEKQIIKELTSKDQELNVTKLAEDLENSHLALIRNTKDTRYLNNRIEFLNFYLNTQSKLYKLAEALEAIVINYGNNNDKLLATHKTEVINDIIQLMRLELHKKEQLISKIDIQKALITNIESQVIELTDKSELLKLAVKELSPTEGLIAKGMSGFLNHFIGQINVFISKIWLYPLELEPIALTEDGLDLDYKFCVKISDNLVIPDVSKGSSAQREVIDLAFRVVSAAYLGLKDGAFYADELGVSFDKAHRLAVFQAISNLLSTSDFSQIFMISHYENTYGCLTNSDIVVLCPANISLPKDTPFNTTVKIN